MGGDVLTHELGQNLGVFEVDGMAAAGCDLETRVGNQRRVILGTTARHDSVGTSG